VRSQERALPGVLRFRFRVSAACPRSQPHRPTRRNHNPSSPLTPRPAQPLSPGARAGGRGYMRYQNVPVIYEPGHGHRKSAGGAGALGSKALGAALGAGLGGAVLVAGLVAWGAVQRRQRREAEAAAVEAKGAAVAAAAAAAEASAAASKARSSSGGSGGAGGAAGGLIRNSRGQRRSWEEGSDDQLGATSPTAAVGTEGELSVQLVAQRRLGGLIFSSV
jgi:hypothetical protein